MKYDIIGDIHVHSNDLKDLLKKMGYGLSEIGHYSHPDWQAIFVGDYIDRGKHSKEIVQLIHAMQENGSAITLMGKRSWMRESFISELMIADLYVATAIKNY